MFHPRRRKCPPRGSAPRPLPWWRQDFLSCVSWPDAGREDGDAGDGRGRCGGLAGVSRAAHTQSPPPPGACLLGALRSRVGPPPPRARRMEEQPPAPRSFPSRAPSPFPRVFAADKGAAESEAPAEHRKLPSYIPGRSYPESGWDRLRELFLRE